ncbi:MAG: amidohydrolase [Clostridia bacterium]|nr:amidohydrolase [Clostridia bacterium]
MLLIRGGLVKPVCGPDLVNGQVLIDGGNIAAVGTDLDVPEGTEVFDASGCLVTPGLVDAHTHIGLDEEAIRWEGADYNETSDPVTPHMRGIDGINPQDEAFRMALEGGVTAAVTGPGSANVIGGTFVAIKLFGRTADEMVLKDPAAMKAAFGENPKGCYGQQGRKAPVTRMGVAALLRETLAKTKRYAEEIEAAEKDTSKTRPYDIKLEAMLPVIRGEIPLKCHAHRADDMLTAIRVAEEFGIRLTLDHCTDGHLIADVLAEKGYPVLVGPSLGNKSKFELKNKTFATPALLHKAGLPVCIITDAPVIPLYYLPLCAGLAVREGLPEDEAWRAITINPARVAGVDSRIGSLEPGKDADIAVFTSDPLHDIQAAARQVFVSGKPVL